MRTFFCALSYAAKELNFIIVILCDALREEEKLFSDKGIKLLRFTQAPNSL